MDNDANDNVNNGTPLAHEKAKLLALPSPIEVLGPEEGSWRNWLSLSSWIEAGERCKRWMFRSQSGLGGRGGRGKGWQIFGLRVLKSCLLIVKVPAVSCFDLDGQPDLFSKDIDHLFRFNDRVASRYYHFPVWCGSDGQCAGP